MPLPSSRLLNALAFLGCLLLMLAALYLEHVEVEAMLERAKPQGVINATPNTLHVPCAIACIERGIPVLVEKPVAESPERAQELVLAAQKHGVPVLVGHHRRHNALTAAAKALIDSGELGKIVAVSAHWIL